MVTDIGKLMTLSPAGPPFIATAESGRVSAARPTSTGRIRAHRMIKALEAEPPQRFDGIQGHALDGRILARRHR